MASAEQLPSFTEAQWAIVDHLCSAYKKNTDMFIRWVCRTSGCAVLTRDNPHDTHVGLATISRGVNIIVTRGIPSPSHIRRALEKAIELRRQVTNLYKEVETVETASTKGHVAFTEQLVAFEEALKTVPPPPKYLNKNTISRAASKGAYDVLEETGGSDNDEDFEAVTAVGQAAAGTNANKKVETQLVSLNNDTLLQDMIIISGSLLLIYVATAANDTFKVKTLNPRALCEGAWIASAALYLARGICFDFLAVTGLSIKDLVIKIQKLLLNHETKALERLPLHTVVPGILQKLNEAFEEDTKAIAILSQDQAAAFEACLSKEDLQMNQMLGIAKEILSNIRSWCFTMAIEDSLYDWVPHIPLARILMDHDYESNEPNMFHAAIGTVIALQTSAVSKQASDHHLFLNMKQTTSRFLQMVTGFINKMPDWIKSLMSTELKGNLTIILHMCRERSTDEATIATSHPWAAGSLILATLETLYSASLPLIHYNRVISIIVHLYHACVRSKACAPIPILEMVTSLFKDIIFVEGFPPKTSLATSLNLYTTKQTGTSKNSSKAKGGAKVKKPTLYSTHPSIAMQFSKPKPGDQDNDLVECVKNANDDKDVPPTEEWSPLTTIPQMCAAAEHGASQTWGIEWGIGDAWVRATLAKIEELLQGINGKKQGLGGSSSRLSALGKVFGKYNEKPESDVFWNLG